MRRRQHLEVALLAGGQLVAGVVDDPQRDPRRARARRCSRRGRGPRPGTKAAAQAALGRAEGAADVGAERAARLARELARDRGAGGDEGPQRRERLAALDGDAHEVGEERRRRLHEGRRRSRCIASKPTSASQLVCTTCGAPSMQRDPHAVEEAGLVRERRGDVDHVLGRQAEVARCASARPGSVSACGLQHALGLAGRARGEQQLGASDRVCGHRQDRPAPPQHMRDPDGAAEMATSSAASPVIQHHDVLERRHGCPCSPSRHRRVVVAAELARHDQHPRVARRAA